jgi:hypothetical protein
MTFPLLSVSSEQLKARLRSLRVRVEKLCTNYEQIMSRAESVESDLDARSEKVGVSMTYFLK